MVQLAFRDVYALQGIRWWSTLGPTRGAAAANRRCRRPAALIGSLIVTLKEKGILSSDDIRQIETNADRYFADDLKSFGGKDS
ncbi:MAG: hypothetical protein ACLPYY_01460 [Acidimicrobiales bacterium]